MANHYHHWHNRLVVHLCPPPSNFFLIFLTLLGNGMIMEIPSSWLLICCHCWPNVPGCVLCQF
jgi:hypothetical protein